MESGPPPLKNHKNMGFLSNTGLDPLKKSQSYQASIQCWVIMGRPAKRHLNGILPGGPMMARFKWYLDPLSSHKKTKIKCCQSWTPF